MCVRASAKLTLKTVSTTEAAIKIIVWGLAVRALKQTRKNMFESDSRSRQRSITQGIPWLA